MTYGYAWWMAPMMVLGVLGFWVLVALTIKYLITGKATTTAPGPPPDPRTVLDARLARGDLDIEEYRRIRDILNQQN